MRVLKWVFLIKAIISLTLVLLNKSFNVLPKNDIDPTLGTKNSQTVHSVIINRLQIGHTRATHARLLGDDDEAICTTCYTSLTVNQILT